METAKVDIRKLQTLNDCINRTIEALNQVRLSVHAGGLGHSAPMQGIGNPAYFGGYPGAYGAFATPFGLAQQLAQQQLAQQTAGVIPTFAGVNPMAAFPNAFGASAGLGHTAFDPRFSYGYEWAADPYATARIAQTFPFVGWGQSPFAWPNV